LPPLLQEFATYRRSVRGITDSSVAREIETARRFSAFLRSRGRSPRRARLIDVDAFLLALRPRYAVRTVRGFGERVRVFLRFLFASGRLRHDLAPAVALPWMRRDACPPRALPWTDVRRILGAIDRSTRLGLRDHALLLTMATYGLGIGEALALRLEDIDWRRGELRVVRPKTGREILLPLLGPVARSLAAYLRRARPRHTTSRAVFVQMRTPFGPHTCAVVACAALRKYARVAGVSASFLGSHALRHSHASRQIDLGASFKVVGDILGHVHPDSTSTYVRVALRRLRPLALPVPS
jgi:integrase